MTVIVAAWILLAALTLWWLATRGTLQVPQDTHADPHAAGVADFRRAFSRWDHGGRPG